jgi:hypothetical protein
MDESDLDAAAIAITEEVGVNISYFPEEGQKNLIHLAPVLGYILLRWILEGVADALREELGEEITGAGKKLTAKLVKRLRRLFAEDEISPTEAAARTSAQAAVAAARAEASGRSDAEVTQAVNEYEQALVGYLVDEGMPARDATRIAQRVRSEAGIQLQLAPDSR